MESIFTEGISIIALVFSALAYLRGRNIDLQNQVYLKKLDAYSDVIGEFFKLLKVLYDIREEAERLILENKSFINELKINELGNKVDDEIEQIHNEIGLKSIFFKEELIDEIIQYLNSLYGEIDTRNSQNPIEDLDSYIAFQTVKLEELIIKMKAELGIDELNKKLLKRVERGNFKRIFRFLNT
ncbi:hypothetical protein [uncultured Algoriphagus sp.]|uniref:hypothetical protein n=1 Tax=uncultured Algoriphagus sp. TaxID=417365 RepID=UPI0030ED4113|tara:strand:- start:6149 stop:6700 length:552 start_codon:yes stop_codon:yes gene_type:complete